VDRVFLIKSRPGILNKCLGYPEGDHKGRRESNGKVKTVASDVLLKQVAAIPPLCAGRIQKGEVTVGEGKFQPGRKELERSQETDARWFFTTGENLARSLFLLGGAIGKKKPQKRGEQRGGKAMVLIHRLAGQFRPHSQA